MIRNAIERRRRRWGRAAALVILSALATDPATAPRAQGQGVAGGRFVLTATTGGGHAAPVVLLRWGATDRPSPYGRYLLRRRAATAGLFTDLAVVEPLDQPAEIETAFPAGSAIRAEAESLLVPSLGDTLGEAFLLLRAHTDPTRAMQRQMLMDGNHGAAIAEGLAFLDASVTDDARYLYELWGLDAGGQAVERLGKVWALAGTDTMLPAPQALTAVKVADEDNPPAGNFPAAEDVDLDGDGRIDSASFGDGRIYLRWDPVPGQNPDRETQPTGFGFDVMRIAKGAGACPAAPPATGSVKLNRYPVMPRGTADTDIGDFFFVDDGSTPGVAAPVKGTTYCYWLVARDLLGQRGAWSAPLAACAPDLADPRQVFGVETEVAGQQIVVRWNANASDPPALAGGAAYVDDTAGYNVYRFTDFNRMVGGGSPDPGARVAANLPAGTTSWIDATAGGPSDHIGRIHWYQVTAVDASVCGRPANEGPASAPARGVIYDTTAPVINVVEPVCIAAANPRCLRNCGASSGDPWCLAGGTSGLWPLPGDDWGFRVPTGGTDGNDLFSVRLYRGVGGGEFKPVEEAFFSAADGGWLARETGLAPRISQKLEYRLRAIDRDSNVGPVGRPLDAAGGSFPVYLRTEPPLRPTVVRVEPDTPGHVKVRWHAPGAEALAGFIVRVGRAGAPDEGAFLHLPAGNLWAETSLDAPRLPRDTDGDGPSPYDVVIRDATKYLADLPGKGGLDAGGEYLQTTVPEPGAGEVVEIYPVDIAGQIGPAAEAPFDSGAPGFRPAWPDRDPGAGFALDGVFVDGVGGAPDHVDLCWEMGAPAEESKAPYVAVFRTAVEAGRPDSYQQRSPLVKIRLYGPSGCPCLAGLTNGVCWQDFSIAPGATYRYTVERFYGQPPAGERHRAHGEIHSAGGPEEVAVP